MPDYIYDNGKGVAPTHSSGMEQSESKNEQPMTHDNSEPQIFSRVSEYVDNSEPRISELIGAFSFHDPKKAKELKQQILKTHTPKADLVEYLNGLYQPSINDIMLDEHQGKERPVVYLDEIINHIKETTE